VYLVLHQHLTRKEQAVINRFSNASTLEHTLGKQIKWNRSFIGSGGGSGVVLFVVVVIIIPISVKACARGWCENKKEIKYVPYARYRGCRTRVLGLSPLDVCSRIVLRKYGISLIRAVVIWHIDSRMGSVRMTVVWVKYLYYYYTHTAIDTIL